jgi:regulator of sirC expression with transglutaminase-like and TPR domain
LQLDAWADEVRPRMKNIEGIQQALHLSKFMCSELGFQGNTERYYNPNNSYLNWVIDHRKGIPITLSVVYLLLAKRLDVPVYGVNMPAHFVVKYEDADQEVFLDLFHGGLPFQRSEGEAFLQTAGIAAQDTHFEPTDTKTILLRMVRNLLHIAHETNQPQMQADLERLLLL